MVHIHIHGDVYLYIYANIYTYIVMVCIYTKAHTYIHMYMHMSAYAYLYVYKTYIHIHICVYMWSLPTGERVSGRWWVSLRRALLGFGTLARAQESSSIRGLLCCTFVGYVTSLYYRTLDPSTATKKERWHQPALDTARTISITVEGQRHLAYACFAVKLRVSLHSG